MKFIEHNLKFKNNPSKRPLTTYLIFHHAEASNCTVEDIHKWHQDRGWSGIGYNIVVYKDGTAHVGRPLDCSDADAYGYNDNSLSVCFVGDFRNESMTAEQVKTGIDITRYFRKLFPQIIPLRHSDVNETSCPEQNFDLSIIYEGVKDAPEPKHWAEESFNTLTDNGIVIHEKRFDDKISRGEIFALLAQIIKK